MAHAQSIDRFLDESTRKPLLYIDVPAPLFTSSSQYRSPTEYQSPQSASSVTTSRRSSTTSDAASQISSAPTSATSIIRPSIGAMEPAYWLQCTFHELDCKLLFHPGDSASWYQHCMSHWNGHHPPRECICIFCDKQFRGSTGWQKRMSHIAAHLAEGCKVEHGRPDFATYRYMCEKGLLNESDYAYLTRYSECPGKNLGLLPSNYQSEKAHASLNDVVFYNQRKEDRERKGRSQKGKGREETRHGN